MCLTLCLVVLELGKFQTLCYPKLFELLIKRLPISDLLLHAVGSLRWKFYFFYATYWMGSV